MRLTATLLGALVLATVAAVGSSCFGGFDETETTPRKLDRQRAAGKAPVAGEADGGATAGAENKEHEQTYREAWQVICNAEQLAGVDRAQSRQARGATVANWIVDHLKNKRARYWFIKFGRAKKEEREALFVAEAERAGFARCALSELLFSVDAQTSADAGPPSGDR